MIFTWDQDHLFTINVSIFAVVIFTDNPVSIYSFFVVLKICIFIKELIFDFTGVIFCAFLFIAKTLRTIVQHENHTFTVFCHCEY